jgi:hypothetical protein
MEETQGRIVSTILSIHHYCWGEWGAASSDALSAKHARNGLRSDSNIHAIDHVELSQLLHTVAAMDWQL